MQRMEPGTVTVSNQELAGVYEDAQQEVQASHYYASTSHDQSVTVFAKPKDNRAKEFLRRRKHIQRTNASVEKEHKGFAKSYAAPITKRIPVKPTEPVK